jgi:lipopolysaccharide export system protein LptC
MIGATDRLAAWVPVLLLSALAGLTYWIDLVVQPPAPARIGPVPHDPDVIVDRMTATRMGPDGRVKHTLIAARMIHYSDDDTTHLASPRFVSYDTRGTPLTITSNEGLVSSEGSVY